MGRAWPAGPRLASAVAATSTRSTGLAPGACPPSAGAPPQRRQHVRAAVASSRPRVPDPHREFRWSHWSAFCSARSVSALHGPLSRLPAGGPAGLGQAQDLVLVGAGEGLAEELHEVLRRVRGDLPVGLRELVPIARLSRHGQQFVEARMPCPGGPPGRSARNGPGVRAGRRAAPRSWPSRGPGCPRRPPAPHPAGACRPGWGAAAAAPWPPPGSPRT